MVFDKWKLQILGVKHFTVSEKLGNVRPPTYSLHKRTSFKLRTLFIWSYLHFIKMLWNMKYTIIISAESYLQWCNDFLNSVLRPSPHSVFPVDTPQNSVSILYLWNFQELVTAIRHPKGLIQEAPYKFLNTKKRARRKVHKTYVGDGHYSTWYLFLIACKSRSISSLKLFLVWILPTFIGLHSILSLNRKFLPKYDLEQIFLIFLIINWFAAQIGNSRGCCMVRIAIYYK